MSAVTQNYTNLKIGTTKDFEVSPAIPSDVLSELKKVKLSISEMILDLFDIKPVLSIDELIIGLWNIKKVKEKRRRVSAKVQALLKKGLIEKTQSKGVYEKKKVNVSY